MRVLVVNPNTTQSMTTTIAAAAREPEREDEAKKRRAKKSAERAPKGEAKKEDAKKAEPTKVGFVYVSPVGQAGWSYQHDLGRQVMARALGAQVKTTLERYAHLNEGNVSGMVALTFSCDGSHYMPYAEFLDHDMPFWLGR